jgi:outer membrane biosynthesis protein TonB
MNTTNSTWTLARNARIALLCGALLAFMATPAALGQSNNNGQSTPVAQNQQNQPATPTNSPVAPNAQPAQPSPNTTPNSTPDSSSTPDASQNQPAQDQNQPATAAPAPDSQQQTDKTTDDQKLPKTASDVPLFGLIAALSLGSAALIHAGRRVAS